jgi:hypothetical protein
MYEGHATTVKGRGSAEVAPAEVDLADRAERPALGADLVFVHGRGR